MTIWSDRAHGDSTAQHKHMDFTIEEEALPFTVIMHRGGLVFIGKPEAPAGVNQGPLIRVAITFLLAYKQSIIRVDLHGMYLQANEEAEIIEMLPTDTLVNFHKDYRHGASTAQHKHMDFTIEEKELPFTAIMHHGELTFIVNYDAPAGENHGVLIRTAIMFLLAYKQRIIRMDLHGMDIAAYEVVQIIEMLPTDTLKGFMYHEDFEGVSPGPEILKAVTMHMPTIRALQLRQCALASLSPLTQLTFLQFLYIDIEYHPNMTPWEVLLYALPLLKKFTLGETFVSEDVILHDIQSLILAISNAPHFRELGLPYLSAIGQLVIEKTRKVRPAAGCSTILNFCQCTPFDTLATDMYKQYVSPTIGLFQRAQSNNMHTVFVCECQQGMLAEIMQEISNYKRIPQELNVQIGACGSNCPNCSQHCYCSHPCSQ